MSVASQFAHLANRAYGFRMISNQLNMLYEGQITMLQGSLGTQVQQTEDDDLHVNWQAKSKVIVSAKGQRGVFLHNARSSSGKRAFTRNESRGN